MDRALTVAAFSGFVYITQSSKELGWPPESHRGAKKQFVKIVARGTLSADQVIGKMVEELQLYERKYGMRSEVFYALIPGTPAQDQPDFLKWAICYRSYFRALQSKFPFKELSGYAV